MKTADQLSTQFRRTIKREIYSFFERKKALMVAKKAVKGNKEAISLLNQQIKQFDYEVNELGKLDDVIDHQWRD